MWLRPHLQACFLVWNRMAGSETEWQVLKQSDRFWNRVTGCETEWQVVKMTGCETEWCVLKQSDGFWNRVTGCETEWQVLKQSDSELGFVYGLRLWCKKYPRLSRRIFCFKRDRSLGPKSQQPCRGQTRNGLQLCRLVNTLPATTFSATTPNYWSLACTLVISMWKHSL